MQQKDYTHIYFVRNGFSGNDQACISDASCLNSVVNLNNTCASNPCQNEGTCYLNLNNTFSCVCPTGFEGFYFIIKNSLKLF